MKKIISIILMIVLLVTLTGCKVEKVKETDASKFKEEYESLNGTTREKDGKTIRTISIPEYNPFVYSSAKEISKKMDDKETFIVYFGFNDCPWCRSIIEELIKVANDYDYNKIYYVDVKDIRDVKEFDEEGNIITSKEGDKYYMELINKMSDVLEDYNLTDSEGNTVYAEEKRIFAPNVVLVSKGKAIELETGISEKLTDPYAKLTSKMRKETYNKFKCLFKCLDEETNTCQKNMC